MTRKESPARYADAPPGCDSPASGGFFFLSKSCIRSENERIGSLPSSCALVIGLTFLGLVGARSIVLGCCACGGRPRPWSRLPPVGRGGRCPCGGAPAPTGCAPPC